MTSGEQESSSLCAEYAEPATSPSGKRSQQEKQDEAERSNDGKWTPLLVLGGVTCCLGSAVPAGFNIGVINNPATIIGDFCNETIIAQYDVRLSEKELKIIWSIVVSIFLVGGVTGSLIASWIADKYGRKGAIAIGNVFGIIGAVLFFFVPMFKSVVFLMLGRLAVGLSGGIATSLLPMYMTEIASIGQRGAVGVLCQLGITVGVFLGQVVGLEAVLGTKDDWHIMLASFAPLSLIALVMLCILPESPKYLYIIEQQEEKAIKELRRLRNGDENILQKEIQVLQEESATRTTMDTWTVGRVLKDPSVRLPLILVASMQLGQQLSGINAVFYYSNIIFEKAHLEKTSSHYGTLATGVINTGMAIISVRLMTIFNRRTLFLCSAYTSAASLVILCIAIKTISDVSFMPWLCMISVLAYVLCYGIGLGPIPYFIGSELFDVAPRPAAMALGSVCNWGGNLIVGLLFPTVESILGSFTFLIFVTCIISLAIFIRTYLPETRGKITTDVTSRLTGGFKSRLGVV